MTNYKDSDKRFWLNWGIAPKGTPKYNAGVKALSFLHQELDRARKEAWTKGYREGWKNEVKIQAQFRLDSQNK